MREFAAMDTINNDAQPKMPRQVIASVMSSKTLCSSKDTFIHGMLVIPKVVRWQHS
eukprot:NODE_11583_length_1277_cov_2.647826.p8 GENE.NODE_11583_length_1277_cov_2.647826~~NODE_11583_length_1277_cov_2.647826.p8  ORF type:complete len:56 (+),score=4.99 NODE_11583_length_1277_cov_2.647826:193-360(+)